MDQNRVPQSTAEQSSQSHLRAGGGFLGVTQSSPLTSSFLSFMHSFTQSVTNTLPTGASGPCWV